MGPIPTDRAERARRRRYAAALGAAGVLAPLGLFHASSGTLTPGQALLAGTVVVLGLLPAVTYLCSADRWSLPLLALNGAFYALAFGLASFFPHLDWTGVNQKAVTAALQLTVAGLALQIGAYHAAGALWGRLRPVRIVPAPPARLRAWAWLFFAAHLAYQYTPSLSELPSLKHFLYPLGWLAMGLLYVQHLRGQLPRAHGIVLFGAALPLELLSRWVSGFLYQFFVVFLFLLLVYWYVRRRVPWAVMAGLAALFVAVNPVKAAYRVWLSAAAPEVSPLEKATAFLDLAGRYYESREASPVGAEPVAGSSLRRVGINVPLFAYVIELTPAVVPHWEGHTYRFFLASLVPRVLWPDKPPATHANEFGRRYSILPVGDYNTAVNLPWLIEFYVNFGSWGVLAGMALVGVAFRFVVEKLSGRGDAEQVLGLSLTFEAAFAEVNLALMWGGLLLSFAAFYATLQLASRRWRW